MYIYINIHIYIYTYTGPWPFRGEWKNWRYDHNTRGTVDLASTTIRLCHHNNSACSAWVSATKNLGLLPTGENNPGKRWGRLAQLDTHLSQHNNFARGTRRGFDIDSLFEDSESLANHSEEHLSHWGGQLTYLLVCRRHKMWGFLHDGRWTVRDNDYGEEESRPEHDETHRTEWAIYRRHLCRANDGDDLNCMNEDYFYYYS